MDGGAFQTARLKNWVVVPARPDGQRLEGNVFGHPDTYRCPDGAWITTTRLRYLNEQLGIGVTRNTVYILRDIPDEQVRQIMAGVNADEVAA